MIELLKAAFLDIPEINLQMIFAVISEQGENPNSTEAGCYENCSGISKTYATLALQKHSVTIQRNAGVNVPETVEYRPVE